MASKKISLHRFNVVGPRGKTSFFHRVAIAMAPLGTAPSKERELIAANLGPWPPPNCKEGDEAYASRIGLEYGLLDEQRKYGCLSGNVCKALGLRLGTPRATEALAAMKAAVTTYAVSLPVQFL